MELDDTTMKRVMPIKIVRFQFLNSDSTQTTQRLGLDQIFVISEGLVVLRLDELWVRNGEITIKVDKPLPDDLKDLIVQCSRDEVGMKIKLTNLDTSRDSIS